MCLLPVTIFADETKDGQPPLLFQQLSTAVQELHAMAMFGIQGKAADNQESWSFSSSFAFHCQRASDSKKGKELESQASVLVAEDSEAVPVAVLQSRNADHNTSFADIEATETACALFKTLMTKTQVTSLEDDVSFWQINWCQVYPPDPTAQVCNIDGSRLWMQVKVEDETGQLNLFMREQAALKRAATESKEDF